MDHYINIYKHHADRYHRMIEAEDVDGNLLPAIKRLGSISGKRVIDLGSGTGRLPLLLHDQTSQVIGVDLHSGMLIEQLKQIKRVGGNWGLVQGDIRELPFQNGWCDIVTAGWAIGHFQSWFADDWENQVDRVIIEMLRVTKNEGGIVIIETLTTGSLTPAPPTENLAKYYAHLEDHWGFTRQEVPTDYKFIDLGESKDLIGFFFGKELEAKVIQNNWIRVPEWTGIWGLIK
jgi:ubiquinone/menaquinone biosynthesis C-methylase UbiE